MDDENKTRGFDRRRHHLSKYQIVRNADDALDACESVRDWLEQLEAIPEIGFDGEHCVTEALKELRRVRVFLRLVMRNEQ
jgi:hypothetical protein